MAYLFLFPRLCTLLISRVCLIFCESFEEAALFKLFLFPQTPQASRMYCSEVAKTEAGALGGWSPGKSKYRVHSSVFSSPQQKARVLQSC